MVNAPRAFSAHAGAGQAKNTRS